MARGGSGALTLLLRLVTLPFHMLPSHAGHSCWGILNAPATGEALAELVVDGKASSSSLAAFDPARLARR